MDSNIDNVQTVRESVHDATDVEIRITERKDGYITIFTHNLTKFEEDQLTRLLQESEFTVYPVTKQGHTRKLLIGEND